MFSLNHPNFLGCMGTWHSMSDTCLMNIFMDLVISTTLVRLDSMNFSIQKMFNMILEIIKDLFNIRFVFKEINPSITIVVIQESNIIFKTPTRHLSRSPNISMNKLKWKSFNMNKIIIRKRMNLCMLRHTTNRRHITKRTI